MSQNNKNACSKAANWSISSASDYSITTDSDMKAARPRCQQKHADPRRPFPLKATQLLV